MRTLITGAGGALGRELSRALAKSGHTVGLLDRTEDAVRDLAKELSGVPLGLADTSAEAFAAAVARFEKESGGPVTGAALVAGGWAGGTPLHEGDRSLASMIELNTMTVHSAFASLLPGMVARKNGSVVVVGSRNVERPWQGAGSAAYTASKAAAVSLARAVAAEVLPFGVRVNAILVSTMDTPANRKAMPDVDPTTWVSTASAAGVIAFLLSEAARDISGAELPVYGRA